jgi:hypothetical protein
MTSWDRKRQRPYEWTESELIKLTWTREQYLSMDEAFCTAMTQAGYQKTEGVENANRRQEQGVEQSGNQAGGAHFSDIEPAAQGRVCGGRRRRGPHLARGVETIE